MAIELKTTVYNLLTGKQGLTNFEFICWRNYYNEAPFGYLFSDYRAALSTRVMLAPYAKGSLPNIKDLLFHRPPEKPKSPEQLAKECQALFGTLRRHQNNKNKVN